MSRREAMTPVRVPIVLLMPTLDSIRKKMRDHRFGTGKDSMASAKAIKASPVPPITCKCVWFVLIVFVSID